MFTYYKVGGCIRDELLGLESKDIDYVAIYDGKSSFVELVFDTLIADVESKGKIFLTTKDCFTIRALIDAQPCDIVLARKELGYTSYSRTPYCTIGTIEDDLCRRDFTINALAKARDGSIIDLFGGIEHLKAQLLVPIGGAERSLEDDPLRVLRAIRFCITKGMKMSAELELSIRYRSGNWAMLWEAKLSQDRIEEELKKCFKHDTLATIKMLEDLQLSDLCFNKDIWLMPTRRK